MLTSKYKIKVSTENVLQELRKKKERIIPASADGPEKEVKLNWIQNTKWIFVVLFCRNRELLKVSGQKSDVIKNMFHEN